MRKIILFLGKSRLGLWIVRLCFGPFFFMGMLLYYLSKVIKGAGYFLMSYTESAKAEFKDFWSITFNLSDL